MSPTLLVILLAISADPLTATPAARESTPPATETTFDTLVVCPAAFREALRPWFELRSSQGHHIAVMSNLATPEEIRAEILRASRGGRLRFVVLVGGANPALQDDAAVRARSVPMHYAQARINVKWGSTPTIPTDIWYVQTDAADDENPVPTVAIGRIPAESAAEVAVIVKKILAYERSTDFGAWRQRMNFVAGVGDFGPLADTVLESAAKLFLTQAIPPEYHVSMTYGNWRSPYCPDPRRFHQATVERLDEAALMWVYIGHSAVVETAAMQVPGGGYPILTASDAAMLRGAQGRPIAMFLACYAGAVDARGRCLASELLAAPGGPVAVVAGSRVTMPYAMAVLATNLTDECFRTPCDTLGEALLHAKQRMLGERDKNDTRRAMLDAVAEVVSPSGKQLAAERSEHVLMFHIIGDPLLSLRHPKPVELHLTRKATVGEPLLIEGNSPIAGRATLELVLRRDRIRGQRPSRSAYPSRSDDLAAFDDVYRRANDRCMKAVVLDLRGGHFQASLDVPDEAAGACHVCVFIAGKADMAMGSADVEVVRSRVR
jgi:hypothetical protein